MVENRQRGDAHDPVTGGTKRRTIPIVRASGPYEYTPGEQESNVELTSVAEMLQWAQNCARSRSVWPLGYGLACCAIEMMASASAAQYDVSRCRWHSLRQDGTPPAPVMGADARPEVGTEHGAMRELGGRVL